MVGIVIVSHSKQISDGVVHLLKDLVDYRLPIKSAGGGDWTGDAIGTNPDIIASAMITASGGDGVIVFVDMGSAIPNAIKAIELVPDEYRSDVHVTAAPLMEGSYVAAVTAYGGGSIEQIVKELESTLDPKLLAIEKRN